MSGTAIKDPDATLDFTRDWSEWLSEDEAIATSEWIITGPDGELTEGTSTYESTLDDTTTTIWLTGGTPNEQYQVTNRVTTDSVPPRIDDRTFILFIQER